MTKVSMEAARRCDDGTLVGLLVGLVIHAGFRDVRSMRLDEAVGTAGSRRHQLAIRLANWLARDRRAAIALALFLAALAAAASAIK
jgi:hypothetical protein